MWQKPPSKSFCSIMKTTCDKTIYHNGVKTILAHSDYANI